MDFGLPKTSKGEVFMGEDSKMWRSVEKLTNSEPLDSKQVGVESQFVLSYHYELVYPGTYHLDPETKIKAWVEPALILFVSVNHSDLPKTPTVLHYGLSRSFFSSGLEPNAKDRTKLMDAAMPLLKEDIKQIGCQEVPNSLSKTRFI
jgi:hypothetical protein